jgi:uncharacterized protein
MSRAAMTTNQSPVTFANKNGIRLFGILHLPQTAERSDTAIILLSPGVKMRTGPHRLYRRMTELFTSLGFPVLRFDFFGLGDSEGQMDEKLLADVYNHMEVGRFVNDAIDAMDWMQKNHGYSRFIMSGLCGGAVSGLLAGSRDKRVVGLLSLGITPVLVSKAADPALYMTVGQLTELRKGYIGKLLDPKSIWRVLTLQSDYRLAWKSLTAPLKDRWKQKSTNLATLSENTDKLADDNANPLFPPAFFEMTSSGRPLMLIFGGSDRLNWEFQEKFVSRHSERLKKEKDMYDVHIIPNANHILSLRKWEKEMLDVARNWLGRRFLHAGCLTQASESQA